MTRLFRTLLALAVILPTGMMAAGITIAQRQAWLTAEQDLVRSAASTAEYAARLLDNALLLADRADDLLRGLDDKQIHDQEETLHNSMARLAFGRPAVLTFYALDSHGHPLVSATVFPVPREIDLRDRDFFKALSAPSAPRATISRVGVGRFDNNLFVSIAERRGASSGMPVAIFTGLVLVSLGPHNVAPMLEAMGDRESDVVSLVRSDGEVLLRSVPFGKPPAAIASDDPLRAVMEAGALAMFVSDTGHDAAAAYRKVEGWPVYVSITRSHQEIVASWQVLAGWQIGVGLPAMLGLLCAVGMTIRQANKTTEAEMLLAAEEERHRVAEELRRGQKLQALGQLAGGVAHDFNNVLQAVQGNAARILRNKENPDQLNRIARALEDLVARGASITGRMLTLARKGNLVVSPIDVPSFLTGLRELLASTLGPNIEVSVCCEDDLPPIMADRSQLETVIINLAANARDAMLDGGRLLLKAKAAAGLPGTATSGRFVTIIVRDTGTGIDDEMLARIGEPFFTTKDVGKGTGLGLSMARGFAEQSGGGLSIESKVGRGTSVSVWLPQADRPPTQSSPSQVRPERAAGLTVLIVEDDLQVCETMAAELRELGLTTLAAEAGEQALSMLDGGCGFDVLVTDLAMPGIDGMQLLREARKRRPRMPAVLLTGRPGIEVSLVSAGSATGPFRLLRKPSPAALVAESVAAVYAAHRAEMIAEINAR